MVNSPFFATTPVYGDQIPLLFWISTDWNASFFAILSFSRFCSKKLQKLSFLMRIIDGSLPEMYQKFKSPLCPRVESPKKTWKFFLLEGTTMTTILQLYESPSLTFSEILYTKTSKSCSTSCAQNTYMTIVALKNGSIPVTFSGAKYVWQRWQKTRIFSATKGQAQNCEAKRSFLKNIIEKHRL